MFKNFLPFITIGLFWISPSARAVCLSPAQGEWAKYEELAFRDPVTAIAELKPHFDALISNPASNPTEIAQLAVILGESARQKDVDDSTIVYAEQGLAQLRDKNSALGLRLRSLRSMVKTAASQAVMSEIENMAVLAQAISPEAHACILKDTVFSLELPKDFDQYAKNLMDAHAQFLRSGNEDERHVTLGRMSRLFIEAGEYQSALSVARISRGYFNNRGAYLRASTASLRAMPTLYLLGDIEGGRAEAKEGLASADLGQDLYGKLLINMHLCSIEALAKSDKAPEICTAARDAAETNNLVSDWETANFESSFALIEVNQGKFLEAKKRIQTELARPFRNPGDMHDIRLYNALERAYAGLNLEDNRQAAMQKRDELEKRMRANQQTLSKISLEVLQAIQGQPTELVKHRDRLDRTTATSASNNHALLWMLGLLAITISALLITRQRRSTQERLNAIHNEESNKTKR